MYDEISRSQRQPKRKTPSAPETSEGDAMSDVDPTPATPIKKKSKKNQKNSQKKKRKNEQKKQAQMEEKKDPTYEPGEPEGDDSSVTAVASAQFNPPDHQSMYPALSDTALPEELELAFNCAKDYPTKCRTLPAQGASVKQTAMYKVFVRLDDDNFRVVEGGRPREDFLSERIAEELLDNKRKVDEEPIALQIVPDDQDSYRDEESLQHFLSLFHVRPKSTWLHNKTLPTVTPRAKFLVLNGQHRMTAARLAFKKMYQQVGRRAAKSCPVYWTAYVYASNISAEVAADLRSNVVEPRKSDSAAATVANFLQLLLESKPEEAAQRTEAFFNKYASVFAENKQIQESHIKKIFSSFQNLSEEAKRNARVYLAHRLTSDFWSIGAWFKLNHIDKAYQEFILEQAADSARQYTPENFSDFPKNKAEFENLIQRIAHNNSVKKPVVEQDRNLTPGRFIYYSCVQRWIMSIWCFEVFAQICSCHRDLLPMDTNKRSTNLSSCRWTTLSIQERDDLVYNATGFRVLDVDFPNSRLMKQLCQWWKHRPGELTPHAPSVVLTSVLNKMRKEEVLKTDKLEQDLHTYDLLKKVQQSIEVKFQLTSPENWKQSEVPTVFQDLTEDSEVIHMEDVRDERLRIHGPTSVDEAEQFAAADTVMHAIDAPEHVEKYDPDLIKEDVFTYLRSAENAMTALGQSDRMEEIGDYARAKLERIPSLIIMDPPFFNTEYQQRWNRIENQRSYFVSTLEEDAELQMDAFLKEEEPFAFCIALLKRLQRYIQAAEKLKEKEISLTIVMFQSHYLCSMLHHKVSKYFDGFFESGGAVVSVFRYGTKKHSQNNKWVNRSEDFVVFHHGRVLKNLQPHVERQKNFLSMPRYTRFDKALEFSAGHRTKKKVKFPYTKPIGLMRFLILMYSRKNDVIWDLFGGSGSTSIAACLESRYSVYVDNNPEATKIFEEKTKPLRQAQTRHLMFLECVFSQTSVAAAQQEERSEENYLSELRRKRSASKESLSLVDDEALASSGSSDENISSENSEDRKFIAHTDESESNNEDSASDDAADDDSSNLDEQNVEQLDPSEVGDFEDVSSSVQLSSPRQNRYMQRQQKKTATALKKPGVKPVELS